MSKVQLQDIGSGYNLQTVVNNNNEFIEEAFENTLSRDGTDPNGMEAPLDMNSHRVINLGAPVQLDDAVRLRDLVEGVVIPSIPEGGTTGQILAKASNDDYDLEWVDDEIGEGGSGGGTASYFQAYVVSDESIPFTTNGTFYDSFIQSEVFLESDDVEFSDGDLLFHNTGLYQIILEVHTYPEISWPTVATEITSALSGSILTRMIRPALTSGQDYRWVAHTVTNITTPETLKNLQISISRIGAGSDVTMFADIGILIQRLGDVP